MRNNELDAEKYQLYIVRARNRMTLPMVFGLERSAWVLQHAPCLAIRKKELIAVARTKPWWLVVWFATIDVE